MDLFSYLSAHSVYISSANNDMFLIDNVNVLWIKGMGFKGTYCLHFKLAMIFSAFNFFGPCNPVLINLVWTALA